MKKTGEVINGEAVGASVDFMREVFSRAGLHYEVKYLPWIRIQSSLKSYQDKQPCEVTWDVTQVDGREDWLYFSIPVYRTRAGFFYSSKFNPKPFALKNVVDLLDYRVCGIRSYEYGVLEKAIDFKVNKEQQALDLVAIGRCDLFYSAIEPIIQGGEQYNTYQIASDIQFTVIPFIDSKWHVVVSRASPRGETLYRLINQVIQTMQEAGDSELIYQQKVLGGTGLMESQN